MIYVDYDFYVEEFCGLAIPEEEFQGYAKKASAKIDFYINEPLTEAEVTDDIKFAMCEICEILYHDETHIGIDYERNDGYWVSYDNDRTVEDRIKACLLSRLGKSGLLYRGRLI